MLRALIQTLRNRARGYARDTRGAVVIIAAVLIPVIVGGLGLWVETGYWDHMQRKVQHAADCRYPAFVAAMKAATEETTL